MVGPRSGQVYVHKIIVTTPYRCNVLYGSKKACKMFIMLHGSLKDNLWFVVLGKQVRNLGQWFASGAQARKWAEVRLLSDLVWGSLFVSSQQTSDSLRAADLSLVSNHHVEIPLHTHRAVKSLITGQCQVLLKIWGNQYLHTLLSGVPGSKPLWKTIY